MATYTFRFYSRSWVDISVDAESCAAAMDLADDKYNNGEYDNGDIEYENDHAELIEGERDDPETTLDAIRDYCRDNIEDYDERVRMAWGKMDRMRCPLSYADESLYTEMQNCLEEYCEDYDLDADDFDLEEII